MLAVFREIEDNELGASELREAGGPLQVSTVEEPDPLDEDVITAGTRSVCSPSPGRTLWDRMLRLPS